MLREPPLSCGVSYHPSRSWNARQTHEDGFSEGEQRVVVMSLCSSMLSLIWLVFVFPSSA